MYLIQLTAQETLQPFTTPKDPLIAKGLQTEQYVGVVTLAIAIIAVVGIISRRIEYALIVAFVISIILIAIFVWL
ncbi:hypothetical protein NIES4071_59370 [Calothrix sp. NIES-4071]|nr:hypothetical protein NIES4071_59370 [Calothrix sp. NIES-4071]BAZ60244.1 hypothetical protein NIES4105_59320 [Calothrix sp. NIES-4105]